MGRCPRIPTYWSLPWPSEDGRGNLRAVGEDTEQAIAVTSIRRRLGVMAVGCQLNSLLSRLDILGPWRDRAEVAGNHGPGAWPAGGAGHRLANRALRTEKYFIFCPF